MKTEFFRSITIGLVLLIVAGCASETVDPAYEKDIQTFRKKRVNYLKSRKGYLNLVGLHWLDEGKYKMGSGQDNDLVLPDGFPSQFGALSKSENGFHFQFNTSVLVDSTDQVVKYNFSHDSLSHHFSWASFQFFIIKRGELYALRIKNFENPILNTYFKIPAYPVDPKWRIKAQFNPYASNNERTISNIYGHHVVQPTAGTVSFLHKGNQVELEVNIEGGKKAIIFMDGTTGKETYGGGRQLYLTEPDNQGQVILDFNKAFNFPCAYNNYTTCPVPPPINHLDLKVTAGAKAPK